ncbi:tyrosine-type recombinase/integrase [Aureimonas frigidaquae]|uniref:tyrosine-type recombinase/integrase n=1 Tax=Aureimonas frigidaquae TaxID=424757 RepID=UPI0007861368|nr:site-specific integrase [Aureimonas frigidaquae]
MSVRKRTWTTPSGEERSAWVCEYTDAGGKRRRKTFKLKKQADQFASSAAVEVRQGVHVADSESTTVEEAGRLWLTGARVSNLERSTVEDYARLLRLHVNPLIGQTRLNMLTISRLRAFEDELREKGRSASMTRRVLTTMSTLLAEAQERGLVGRNVARDMRSRRGGGEGRHQGKLKVGVDIPNREEIRALINSVSGRWRPLILVAAFCGLRASELRGLRWVDVDLGKREIHVRQRADRFNAIGSPKSVSGERTVPLPPMALNTLREWKVACPKGKLGLVFPNMSGNVEVLGNILKRGLHPAWVAAGVSIDTGKRDKKTKPILVAKYSGLHALRHWHASWLINRKEDGGLALPPKSVQERMGHSTIAMTMDTYSHLFPRGDDEAELAEAEASVFG